MCFPPRTRLQSIRLSEPKDLDVREMSLFPGPGTSALATQLHSLADLRSLPRSCICKGCPYGPLRQPTQGPSRPRCATVSPFTNYARLCCYRSKLSTRCSSLPAVRPHPTGVCACHPPPEPRRSLSDLFTFRLHPARHGSRAAAHCRIPSLLQWHAPPSPWCPSGDIPSVRSRA